MIQDVFKSNPAFIAYVTGGDGGLDYSLECALALIKGGVDLLEIGIPFSDPIADGPVIQRAMMRAIANHTTPEQILEIAEGVKKRHPVPIVLFTYYNPILQLGRTFLEKAASKGIDGLLIVDLPFEQEVKLPEGMQRILIATPSTSNERLEKIGKLSEGFVYYACQKGTTGIRQNLPAGFEQDVRRIKSCTGLPVAAGFGISNSASAKEALRYADGFVVGSYFVDAMEKSVSPEVLKKMAEAIDPRV